MIAMSEATQTQIVTVREMRAPQSRRENIEDQKIDTHYASAVLSAAKNLIDYEIRIANASLSVATESAAASLRQTVERGADRYHQKQREAHHLQKKGDK